LELNKTKNGSNLSGFESLIYKHVDETERNQGLVFKEVQATSYYNLMMKQMLYLDKEQKYVISMINTQTYCLNI